MAKETSKGHKKHADIKRPSLGVYGRHELGLIGAPCGVIKKIVEHVADALKDQVSITYLDADHQEGMRPPYSRATDHISHDSIEYASQHNDFDRKLAFTSSDLLLINGNHFLAGSQIVFCTEKKRDSLLRKLDRLTDVKMIILDHGIEKPHDFLTAHIDSLDEVQIYKIDQLTEISNWILTHHQAHQPTVKGLVLAGGKSQRMGQPKELLDYHGLKQVDYAAQILEEAGMTPHISCRDKDQARAYNDYNCIVDSYTGLGPNGAILSAFREDPDSAWCVIACDQPLLQSAHLTHLLSQREMSKMATCYHNPETGWPEPLITIWEPRAYQRLLSFLGLGYSCPRKVLINSDTHVVQVEDTSFMKNANTPEERKQILADLK